jgi:hypothetical protein
LLLYISDVDNCSDCRRVHIVQGGGLVKLRRVRFCAFDFDNWVIALVLLMIVLMEPL